MAVRGYETHVLDNGNAAGATVVFIHGFASTPRHANRRALSQLVANPLLDEHEYRLLAPVLPGFDGVTPLQVGDISLDGFAHWCLDFLVAAGVEGPVILVGESMGGAIAMKVAALQPSRVAAVAVFNSVGMRMTGRNRMSWVYGVFRSAAPRPWRPGQLYSSLRDVGTLGRHPRAGWHASAIIVDADLRPTLQAVKRNGTPVVAVFGRNDRVVLHSSSEMFASELGIEPLFIHGDHRSFLEGHPAIAFVVSELLSLVKKDATPSTDPAAAIGPDARRRWGIEVAGETEVRSAQEWRTERAVIGEYTLSYRVKGVALGESSVVVVGLHGLGMTGNYFTPLGDAIDSGATVLFPDLVGFGASSKPVRVLTIREHAEVVAKWLDDLGVSRVVVVGNSYGCQVAVELGLMRPELVGGALLVGPTTDRRKRQATIRQSLELLIDATRERPRTIAYAFRGYARCSPRRAFRTFRQSLDHHIDEITPRLEMPVRIIRGERDPIVPQGWVDYLADLSPNCESAAIEGAAHGAHMSHPQAVAAVVLELIALSVQRPSQ